MWSKQAGGGWSRAGGEDREPVQSVEERWRRVHWDAQGASQVGQGPDGGLGPPNSLFTRASFLKGLEVGFDLKPGPRRHAAPLTAARVKAVRPAQPMGGPATGLLPVVW